jgi:hypothetical protein
MQKILLFVWIVLTILDGNNAKEQGESMGLIEY